MDLFIAQCKGIQDSLGFWIWRWGFRIPGTGFRIFCHWKLDSGFQILWSVFRIPKPKILDSTNKIFPDSRIWIPFLGAILSLNVLFFLFQTKWCYPRELFRSKVVLSTCIWMHNYERTIEKIMWSELRKRKMQAKKVYNQVTSLCNYNLNE